MSEHWEYFPCQVGEHSAFVFYDHGIAEEIDAIAVNQLFRIRIIIKEPAANGLPGNDEADALVAMEEDIETFIDQYQGYYVGRVTVDGASYFYNYLDIEEGIIAEFVEELSQRFDYRIGFNLEQDENKSAYWEELFPGDDDWRVISDMKVLERLREHGDNSEVTRPIMHWAYFTEADDRDAFRQWLESENYNVDELIEPDEEYSDYGVSFYHTGRPLLDEISLHSINFMQQAQVMNGEYDGWETSIEK